MKLHRPSFMLQRVVIVSSLVACTFAQTPPPAEDGIPVTDATVIAKCSGCHKKDDKGNLTRISWVRTNPEGWQQVIKRMIRLNGLQLSADEARHVVQSLSNSHGLAPEEAKAGAYFPERRYLDETIPDAVRQPCASCHPYGRAMNWRRSNEEWKLLADMHTGYFPVAEWTVFRNGPRFQEPPPPAPGAPPPDNRHPVEKALEQVSRAFPLHTAEWADWRASMRAPKLSGRWIVTASQPGMGKFIGEMTIEPGATPDTFSTKTRLTPLSGGAPLELSGKANLYTGYAWRGRATGPGGSTPALPKEARQVMIVSRDQASAEGRWFWGAYEEFGLDVKLRRAGDPMIHSLDVSRLRTGVNAQRVRVFGDQIPAGLTPADIDFGAGVKVSRIVAQSPNELTVEVDVDSQARNGRRDLAVRRLALVGAVAVYDKVDYVKAPSETALARLGGNTHPKGYWQFEAIAWNRGADGKPNTSDDVNLGPVDVEWSIEEHLAVYGDDDKDFVGQLNSKGFFTPAAEGPNPKRKFSRNNYGDVWVVATYKGADAATAKDGKPLSTRTHLIVTVPLYMKWDQPEVAE